MSEYSLQPAIELSEQILAAIESDAWDNIDALDVERRHVITSYFSAGQPIDADATRLLHRLNEQIVEQLNTLKQQTRQAQLTLNKGTKATKAYTDLA